MYDARHPESAVPAAVIAPSPAGLAPIKVSPDVLGKVGEHFSGSLSLVQRSLATLALHPIDPQKKLDAVLAEIDRLEHFGVQIQELARVLGGHAFLSPERIDLAASARAVSAEWNRPVQAGAAVPTASAPASTLEVNPAALAQLLDFGMEHALRAGSSVEVDVTLPGQLPRPTLTIRTRRSNGAPGFEEEADEVHWLLFEQLARAMSLVPHRLATKEGMELTLEFPGAGEDSAANAAASPALPHTASASGRRVLLIEANDFSRVHAYKLLRDIGVHVDACSTIGQALAACLHCHAPDAVITGISADDERCRALLDAIRAEQPRLRVIELVDDAAAFSLSVPGSDHPARIGRQDMARTLARALAQELDGAWPEA